MPDQIASWRWVLAGILALTLGLLGLQMAPTSHVLAVAIVDDVIESVGFAFVALVLANLAIARRRRPPS